MTSFKELRQNIQKASLVLKEARVVLEKAHMDLERRCRQAFNNVDKDGTNKINIKEYLDFLLDNDDNIDDIHKMLVKFKHIDLDSNHELSFQEVMKFQHNLIK